MSSLSTVSGRAGNLCTVCHGTSGPPLNSFGTHFGTNWTVTGIGTHTIHIFDAALELRDSDVDTFSNITEINAGTFPGNASSKPSTPDTTAPTVSLTAPAGGSSFTTAQTVTINATAADAGGVTKVEFYDGTTLLGTDTTAPYSFGWVITSADNGSHSLTAKAYDAATNVGTSTPAVGVTINIATALNGAALYSTNCSGCHGALASSSKKGKSANQIQTAINNNAGGVMGPLSTLTPAEIQAIATALAASSPPSRSDRKAPRIRAFRVPKKASSLEVHFIAFSATDNVGVTGYRVSESRGFSSESRESSDDDWSSTPPLNYTFDSPGKKVLYAQVRDAAGNISKTMSARVLITLPAGQDNKDQGLSKSSLTAQAVQRVAAYDAIVDPVISADLLKAKPVAVGAIAEGGNILSLEVGLGKLQFPVDAYLTLYSPSESGEPVHAYTLNAQNEFEPLVDTKQVWRAGVTALQEVISETPAAELVPGKYMIVFEIKMQGSTDLYHSWMTSFIIQ